MRATSARERSEQTRSLILAEGNFEEHPFFRVGDRNAGTGILHYETELKTRDGHTLKQSWVVRAAHGRGLPGRFDQDVYVALLQLLDERGLPDDGWLSFSLYELVELMGRKHSGRDYQQVRESLQRLASTSVESNNAFYHRGRKEYVTDTFSLLSRVKLAELEDRDGGRTDRNRVQLSEYFVDSYKANYLKDIDTRLYWSLASPVAKRLYRLIDKKRNGRQSWEAELFSLRARIPLSDYRYASKIKEKLAPAHAELIDKGFLERFTYRKNGKSEFVGYRITDSFQARRMAQALPQPSGDEFFCIERLKAEGMNRETAERLVDSHGATRVMHYVEAVAHQKNLRNPAGWLRKAIESGYDLDAPPSTGPQPPLAAPETPPSAAPEAALEASPEPVPETPPPPAPEPPATDPAAEALWSRVLDEFSGSAGDASLAAWFQGTVPVARERDPDRLVLSAPSGFARQYITERFGGDLQRALSRVLGTGPSPTEAPLLEVRVHGDR